jgi:tetratricopeptide (TPR) repeat protein
VSNPPDAVAHYYYGKILIERNQQAEAQSLPEARRQLEQAIKLDPKLAEADTELGVLLSMQGQFSGAREELERAVHLDPESSAAYYELARIYGKLGETAHAQEALRKFQQLKATQKRNQDQEAVRSFLAGAKE